MAKQILASDEEFITYDEFPVLIEINTIDMTEKDVVIDQSIRYFLCGKEPAIKYNRYEQLPKELDITFILWSLKKMTINKPWLKPEIKFLWPINELSLPKELPKNKFDFMYKSEYRLVFDFLVRDKTTSYADYDYGRTPNHDECFWEKNNNSILATEIYWIWEKKLQDEPLDDHKVIIHWGKDYELQCSDDDIRLEEVNDRSKIRKKTRKVIDGKADSI